MLLRCRCRRSGRRSLWWLSSVLASACSGPDLKPVATEPPAGDELPLSLPEGAYCPPARLPTRESVPELASGAGPVDCAASVNAEEHSPVRPLGIGYQRGENLLPPRMAYLTFDDGPSEWTQAFLEVLAEKGVKATFFVTAKQLKGDAGLDGTYVDQAGNTIVFRDLLKRIVDDGHVLGNHTVNHPDLARITRAQVTSEIEENELLVNRALVRAGAAPQLLGLFRPPYGSPWYTGIAGETPPLASERISSHGLNMMWTITSTDAADWAQGESYSRWVEPVRDPEPPTYEKKMARVRDSVLASDEIETGAGMIVLMHDTHSVTRDVLPGVIDGLVAAGYTFDTLEHYVEWRWGRPSIELTPGPSLYNPCVEERNWGCASFGAPAGTDRAAEVCGRMWLGYEALGGVDALGAPVGAQARAPESGIVSQAFERASIELHPENQAPCNVIAIPQ